MSLTKLRREITEISAAATVPALGPEPPARPPGGQGTLGDLAAAFADAELAVAVADLSATALYTDRDKRTVLDTGWQYWTLDGST